ncbi:MAG TPA: hypothetical protein DD417_18415 [Elusimicrobia bacterium]|nr:hypothetical protein [Elusimicrobiota bacterium]
MTLRTMTMALSAAVCLGMAPEAGATPSTQIWIPSSDVQAFKVTHLNIDTYLRARNEGDGTRKAALSMVGPTIGVLPWRELQAEVGFDLMYQGVKVLDDNPLYFHAKLGTPEDSLGKWSPALAVGGYNLGTKDRYTNQNICYGVAARTLPVLGRISAGYYAGNGDVLVDERGERDKDGVLLSWDRTMKEVSDKLWLAADYQGGQSSLGAANFGFAWAFTEKTSVIFGYDIYNNRNVAGKNTFTIQVDINL